MGKQWTLFILLFLIGGCSNARDPAERVPLFAGEYVLQRDYQPLLEDLPGGEEYERIRVYHEDGAYQVVYHGVVTFGEHGFVGIFIVQAQNVEIEPPEISFQLGMRRFFASENAPKDLKEAEEWTNAGRARGMSRTLITLTGTLTEDLLTLRCDGQNCSSSPLTFHRR